MQGKQQSPSQPAPPLGAAQAVLQFLASVGPSADAEFYLRLFRGRARESFAALVVEAAALEHDADGVAVDLRFLRDLELTPVVVLGLDGPDTAAAHGEALRELLRDAEVEAQTFAIGAEDPDYAEMTAAVRRGVIALVTLQANDASTRLSGLARMLTALVTHKLIFLSPEGGLSQRGERLSVVNLSTEYDALHGGYQLDARQRRLLEDSRRLVFDLVPHPLLIAVTSPLNLLHELFTVKGAGTLLRQGARITRHDGYAGVDRDKLSALLTSSFGKAPAPGLWSRPLAHAYIEADYRGAALVQNTELGGYLSKFAVTREAQGEGIGQDLWNALVADHPALVWRARRANPIRAWYERKCQGRFEAGDWTVYFRGLHTAQVQAAIEFSLTQPADF
jgi:acetylglutamate synthase